jgi:Tfp pilus assembly protein PilF
MDLTLLTTALLVALGLLATDAVLNSGSVAVEVAGPSDVYKKIIDQRSLETVFTSQLDRIAATVSVANAPEIRSSSSEGIGMVLADSANLRPLAFALQQQMGYNPDHLRFALFMQDGALRGVVSGDGRAAGKFSQEFEPQKDEPLLNFVQRCATWGAAQLAPYTTALFMLQHHAGDGDFRDVEAIAAHALAALPPAPLSEERAQFENLLGLVELFRNDPRAAQRHFQAAADAWPDSAVPVLNLAFTQIQLDDNAAAAARMRALLDRMHALLDNLSHAPKPLVATAHMTLAAALMGQHDLDGAEAELRQALEINPGSASATELWAELKQLRGDAAGARRLYHLAPRNSTAVENFGELAALYFHLSWRDNEPVTRSRFSNPGVVNLH